jgi:hypothetical protein
MVITPVARNCAYKTCNLDVTIAFIDVLSMLQCLLSGWFFQGVGKILSHDSLGRESAIDYFTLMAAMLLATISRNIFGSLRWPLLTYAISIAFMMYMFYLNATVTIVTFSNGLALVETSVMIPVCMILGRYTYIFTRRRTPTGTPFNKSLVTLIRN